MSKEGFPYLLLLYSTSLWYSRNLIHLKRDVCVRYCYYYYYWCTIMTTTTALVYCKWLRGFSLIYYCFVALSYGVSEPLIIAVWCLCTLADVVSEPLFTALWCLCMLANVFSEPLFIAIWYLCTSVNVVSKLLITYYCFAALLMFRF